MKMKVMTQHRLHNVSFIATAYTYRSAASQTYALQVDGKGTAKNLQHIVGALPVRVGFVRRQD